MFVFQKLELISKKVATAERCESALITIVCFICCVSPESRGDDAALSE